jgi:hypothetical protein
VQCVEIFLCILKLFFETSADILLAAAFDLGLSKDRMLFASDLEMVLD